MLFRSTRFTEEFGRVIVLEDDLLTSPYFLDYMNEGLELYRDEPDVTSIQAYMYPLDLPSVPDSYFLPSLGCWGWGTWQRAWKNFEPNGLRLLQEIRSQKLSKKFDLNNSYPRTKLLQLQVQGKVDSWAIRWIASNFLLDKKIIHPFLHFRHCVLFFIYPFYRAVIRIELYQQPLIRREIGRASCRERV